MKIVFWKKKDINLGEQLVSEITVLEYKKLFSIKLFHFHKTDGKQDRFHTHSFSAFSLLLTGNYVEEIIVNDRITKLDRNRKRIVFFPKKQYHRITKSDGCRTLLITGPWEKFWKELRHLGGDDYREVIQTEGRTDYSFGKIIQIKDK